MDREREREREKREKERESKREMELKNENKIAEERACNEKEVERIRKEVTCRRVYDRRVHEVYIQRE